MSKSRAAQKYPPWGLRVDKGSRSQMLEQTFNNHYCISSMKYVSKIISNS